MYIPLVHCTASSKQFELHLKHQYAAEVVIINPVPVSDFIRGASFSGFILKINPHRLYFGNKSTQSLAEDFVILNYLTKNEIFLPHCKKTVKIKRRKKMTKKLPEVNFRLIKGFRDKRRTFCTLYYADLLITLIGFQFPNKAFRGNTKEKDLARVKGASDRERSKCPRGTSH